jgi:hypothetical protein
MSNAPAHETLVCGLSAYGSPSPCPGCAAEGDPADDLRPGPQAHNQIAGSFEGQIRRALGRHGRRRKLVRLILRIVRRVLVAELPEAVAVLVEQALQERNRT